MACIPSPMQIQHLCSTSLHTLEQAYARICSVSIVLLVHSTQRYLIYVLAKCPAHLRSVNLSAEARCFGKGLVMHVQYTRVSLLAAPGAQVGEGA